MGIFIKDAKEVKSIFAAVPFQNVNEFSLHGNAKQNTTSGKNLLPNKATTQTINGVTFTVNEDGSVTANGTATANAWFKYINNTFKLDAGNYILNGCPSGGSGSTYSMSIYDGSKYYQDSGKGKTIELVESTTFTLCQIGISNGYTANNLVFKPMIRLASITDDTYEPYTGGMASPNPDYPQEIEVPGESYNILENTATSKTVDGVTFTVNEDKSVTANGKAEKRVNFIINNSANMSDLKVGEKYIISGCPKGGTESTYRLQFYKTSTTGNAFDYGNGVEFMFEDSAFAGNIAIAIMEGVTVENLTFYPMIRKVTVESDAYMPYGVGSITVKSVGNNLLGNLTHNQLLTDSSGKVVKSYGYWGAIIDVREMDNICISGDFTLLNSNTVRAGLFSEYPDIGTTGTRKNINTVGSLNVSDCNYVLLSFMRTDNGTTEENGKELMDSIMVNSGTKILPYEPYKEITVTLQTPNGLPGIPVESGGNYTDSNGQQRICDEIVKYADGSGERIQRVKKITEDGTKSYVASSVSNPNGKVFLRGLSDASITTVGCISNKYQVVLSGGASNITPSQILWNVKSDGTIGLYMVSSTATSATEFIAEVKNNPFEILYTLAEPIRTPLTAEEIAAIEKLSEICPANNVSVSADCDLTLLIGKRYETKKIVSAWANKNGVATKVFSSGMKMLVFVGADGLSYSTTDMVTWESMSGADTTLYSVTYGKDRFVAVGSEGKSYYSTDGKTWIAMGPFATSGVAATATYTKVYYANKVFVAVGNTSGIYYSTDGETWTKSETSVSGYPKDIAYGKINGVGRFVVLTNGGVTYTSSNGKTWTQKGVLDNSHTFVSVAYGNKKFVGISTEGYCYFSTDCETWTRITNLLSISGKRIIYANYTFVVVGSGGTAYTQAAVGANSTWSSSSLTSGVYDDVTYNDGQFITVNSSGIVYTSPDGKTWERLTTSVSSLPHESLCFAIDGGYDNK